MATVATPDGGKRKRKRPRKPSNIQFRKICRRRESAGVVFDEWLVIGVGEKVTSPNTPAGVGVSKSEFKFVVTRPSMTTQ